MPATRANINESAMTIQDFFKLINVATTVPKLIDKSSHMPDVVLPAPARELATASLPGTQCDCSDKYPGL